MKHKVTFLFENGSASGTYTSSPPAGGAVSLRLVSVAVPQAELRFSVSPGDRFIAAPLLRSPQGEAKVRVVPRGSRTNIFLPRIQKLSPLCTLSLLFVSPVLPVLRGFSGGGAALSSLCRRFPGGDIMNLTSRRSPLSGLSFLSFFFLRERKTDWLRRCRKIPVRKLNPTTATNQTLSPANLICTLSSSHAAAKPAATQASFMSVP